MKKYLSRLLAVILAVVLLAAPASALTVEQALELLDEYYLYSVPDEARGAQSLDELFAILGDPYSGYMDEEEYQRFLSQLEGGTSLVGIGVTIQFTDRGILVVEVLPSGSAQGAGLQPGDLIVEVDGVSCVPADERSQALILGEEGTQLDLTVLRGEETVGYTLTRRPVVIPNVQVQVMEGGVGLVDCNGFGAGAGKEFADGVRQHDSQVDWWLLDLRGNGGGYTDAAVDMLNALGGPGRYLYLQDGGGAVVYYAGKQDAATAKPVVVLTDGGSASSSEIVASGVRDLGRGVVIGSRTYGKGVAQIMCNEEWLPEYFDGDGMRLTADRFYSAGFNTTDRVGVIPTLLVDNSDAYAVAMALFGRAEDAKMAVLLGSSLFYIDPAADSGTLAALLSALPPQARVYYNSGSGAFDECTPAEAAAGLGISYRNRWFADAAEADAVYARAINAMATYGLLSGTGGGRFNPGGKLTRAQLCVMLARVLNVGYSGPSRFPDVPADGWYGPSVNAIAALGLMGDMGDGRFHPGDELTQEQFITVLGRMARFLNLQMDGYGNWLEGDGGQLILSLETVLTPYSDWARTSAAILAWGLEDALGGEGDMLYAPLNKLDPGESVSRAEAAAGMYAVLRGLRFLP